MFEILFLISLNLLNVFSKMPVPTLPACHEKMCDLFSDPVNSQLVKESGGWNKSGGVKGGHCEASCSNPERKLRCSYTYDKALRPDDIQRGIWICEKASTAKAGEKCTGFTTGCEDGFKCSKSICVENSTPAPKGEPCSDTVNCEKGLQCMEGTCFATTSKKGASCGGSHYTVCEEGLECSKRIFVCESKTAKKGESCGGFSDMACVKGLKCYETNTDDVGTCVNEISNQGEICGSHTDIKCAKGLRCQRQSQNPGTDGTCVSPKIRNLRKGGGLRTIAKQLPAPIIDQPKSESK